MGALKEDLAVPYDTIKAIAAQVKDPSLELIVKLRSLWLLERVATSYNVKRESEKIPTDLFEPLVDFFSVQTEFVLQYQSLKSLMQYLRQLSLQQVYPTSYQ